MVTGITDKRKFWQTVKPNDTDKTLRDERATLADGDEEKRKQKIQLKNSGIILRKLYRL